MDVVFGLSPVDLVFWPLWAVFALGMYFLPAVVAFRRRHRSGGVIFGLNVFLPAVTLLVGWVALLVWAFRGAAAAEAEPAAAAGPAGPAEPEDSHPGDLRREFLETVGWARRRRSVTSLVAARNMLDRIGGDTGDEWNALRALAGELLEPGTVWLAEFEKENSDDVTVERVVLMGFDLDDQTVAALRIAEGGEDLAGRPQWVEIDVFEQGRPSDLTYVRAGGTRYELGLAAKSTFVDVSEVVTASFDQLFRRVGALAEADFRQIERAMHMWDAPPALRDLVAVDGLMVRVLGWLTEEDVKDRHNDVLIVELELRNTGSRPQTFDPAAPTLFTQGKRLYTADVKSLERLNPGVTVTTELWFHVPKGLDLKGAALTLRGQVGSVGIVTRPFS